MPQEVEKLIHHSFWLVKTLYRIEMLNHQYPVELKQAVSGMIGYRPCGRVA